mgnify:CR=1 FL=1
MGWGWWDEGGSVGYGLSWDWRGWVGGGGLMVGD